MKFIFSILIASSLFFAVAGQAQAAVVSSCTTQANCKVNDIQYTCKGVIGVAGGDDPATPAVVENGKCGGPCTTDAECAPFTSAPFSWSAVKCTGTGDPSGKPGVCAELPPGTKQLPGGPATGLALLDLVDLLTNWVFAIFVILAIIFVLLAAFQFVTAGGEAEKVSEARQKLIWAAVGIIIALISKGLVPVIKNIVGG